MKSYCPAVSEVAFLWNFNEKLLSLRQASEGPYHTWWDGGARNLGPDPYVYDPGPAAPLPHRACYGPRASSPPLGVVWFQGQATISLQATISRP